MYPHQKTISYLTICDIYIWYMILYWFVNTVHELSLSQSYGINFGNRSLFWSCITWTLGKIYKYGLGQANLGVEQILKGSQNYIDVKRGPMPCNLQYTVSDWKSAKRPKASFVRSEMWMAYNSNSGFKLPPRGDRTFSDVVELKSRPSQTYIL